MHDTAIADIAKNTDRPGHTTPTDAPTDTAPTREARLVELVFHLAGCSASEAVRAVGTPPAKLGNDEAIARVAAALVALRR